jgi:hypothetical protein
MKREDIEKAAEECRLTTAQSMGVYGQYHSIDECPEHGLSCDELVEGSFIKGAEWRINSVWHSNNRTYKAQKPALVIFKNGKAKVYDNLTDLTIESLWGEIDRFAYIEDLIPNMED